MSPLQEETLQSDRGSRSPSPVRRRNRSISPDRMSAASYRSRSRSISPDREVDFIPSRTPSEAYASEGDGGYRSRSPSVSPDREIGQAKGDDDGMDVDDAASYRSRSRSVSLDRQ
jgi:hypothetical protein